MVLVVCGCKSTLLMGATLPFACNNTGTSWRSGATTVTRVGGWPPPALAGSGAAA